MQDMYVKVVHIIPMWIAVEREYLLRLECIINGSLYEVTKCFGLCLIQLQIQLA